MKKIITAISLMTFFVAHSGQASCLSKAEKSNARKRKIMEVAYYNDASKVAMMVIGLGAAPALFPTYIASGFVAVGLKAQHDKTINLLKDARGVEGATGLDHLVDDIASERPDLTRERLAEILTQADTKELICKRGLITGSLLRNLIIDGDVERAIESNTKIDVAQLMEQYN